ncbi:MAG: TonB-dependent receptor [Terracidiphilus sp.]
MRFSRFCFLSILSLSLVAAVGFVASFPGSVAHAQGIITGGITGTAVDQTGAVIPTAAIEAKSEATGVILQAKANAEGDFRIADVPIGAYTVTVSASGFTSTVLSHVHVISGNETPLGKVTMGLGKTAQSVEVEASAAEIMNTESAQGELSLSTAQLATVPVAGAFDNVTLVVPGVVQTHSDAFSNTNGVNYSVNGQRGRSNNSEIDGQTNNDNSIGGPSFFFSNQDAIQEVDIITTEMGAQYGRNMGAVVNYITKSGTNTFHGSGFEYYLGSWGSSLEAGQKDTQYGFCPAGQFNSCLNDPTSAYYGYAIPKVGRFVENRWGGTLGGPVLRNKLWLFGSTFWTHEYQSGSLNTSAPGVFPDANGLQELQTDYPNNPAVAGLVQIGPYANKQGSPAPVAGTTTQVQVTDGNTVNSIEMSQVGRYLEAHVLDQEHLGRLDYDMTSKDKFYIRYAYQNNPWIPAWYLYSASVIAGGGYSAVSGITHEVGGDWTHSFTTNLANQLRYAFQQAKIGFEGGSIPTCTNSNFFPCTSTITLGPSNFSIGYGGAFPQGRDVKVNQIQDNAQWTHGRHTILFGTEIDYQNSPQFGLPNSEGSFNFSTDTGAPIATGECGSACDNGYSGLLQDSGLLGLSEGKTVIPYTEWDYGVYFQDNFKVSSSLTLNLGLRYEYFGQAINLLNKESVAQQTGSNPFWSTSLPLSATTYPTSNPDRRNIEPRIGLAYTPSNMPKMVVHAGFAMNVDPAFYNIFLDAAQAAPLILADGAIPCGPGAGVDGANVNCIPSSGNFTFGPVQAADDSLLPTGGDPRANPYWLVQKNFRNPMDETYTLGIQYQVAPAAVAEVRYVGSHTFGQFQSLNTNPDILDVQNGGFPNYGSGISVCTDPTQYGYTRPNCDYGLVTTIGNTAFNIYNAMDASLTVRDFHHWTGTASYSLVHVEPGDQQRQRNLQHALRRHHQLLRPESAQLGPGRARRRWQLVSQLVGHSVDL